MTFSYRSTIWSLSLFSISIYCQFATVVSNTSGKVTSRNQRFLQLAPDSNTPSDYVDDVYHCRDPSKKRDGSISCSEETWRWNINELDPERPPETCSYHFPEDFNPDQIENLPDDLEPCMLWWRFYHDSNSPTDADVVVQDATTEDNQVETFRAVNETETHGDLNRELEAFELTYFFDAFRDDGGVRRRSLFSIDRPELHAITTMHIFESFQAKLGSGAVKKVNLILASTQIRLNDDSSAVITESISGQVIFHTADSIPRSSEVQEIVQQAFESNGLELYVFRLNVADDPALRNVYQVTLGHVDVMDTKADKSTGGMLRNLEWTGPVIAIASAVVAASCAVGLLTYILCMGGRRRGRRRQRKKDNHKDPPGVSRNQSSGSKTKPSYDEDEEAGQPPVQIDDDDQSQATSTYSYLQDDSMSLAASYLYSIHESDGVVDDAKKSAPSEKGTTGNKTRSGKQETSSVMQSVIDAYNTTFGTNDEVGTLKGPGSNAADVHHDVSEFRKFANKAPTSQLRKFVQSPANLLGGLSDKGSFDDENSGGNSYFDDDKSLISEMGVQRVLQLEGVPATPVNQNNFDALWEDDKGEKVPLHTAETARKNNTTKSLGLFNGPETRLIDTVPQTSQNDHDKSSKRSVGSRRSVGDRSKDSGDNSSKDSKPSALSSTKQQDTSQESISLYVDDESSNTDPNRSLPLDDSIDDKKVDVSTEVQHQDENEKQPPSEDKGVPEPEDVADTTTQNTKHAPRSVRKKSNSQWTTPAEKAKSGSQAPLSQLCTNSKSLVAVCDVKDASKASLQELANGEDMSTAQTSAASTDDKKQSDENGKADQSTTRADVSLAIKEATQPGMTPLTDKKIEGMVNEVATPDTAIKVGSLVKSFDELWSDNNNGLRPSNGKNSNSNEYLPVGLNSKESFESNIVLKTCFDSQVNDSTKLSKKLVTGNYDDEKKEEDLAKSMLLVKGGLLDESFDDDSRTDESTVVLPTSTMASF